MDQNALEEATRVKLHAGLKAVQPTIARELKVVEDLIVSEYEPLVRKKARNRLATLKRDKKSRARGQPVMFTRAEVAEAKEVWKARRNLERKRLDFTEQTDLKCGYRKPVTEHLKILHEIFKPAVQSYDMPSPAKERNLVDGGGKENLEVSSDSDRRTRLD